MESVIRVRNMTEQENTVRGGHLGQLLPDLRLGHGGTVGVQHVHNLSKEE